jgi:predicted molibdopterin-dependent oxidoreductase YjgC
MAEITIDGRPVSVAPELTIAAALIQDGVRSWRSTRNDQRPRGIFCGIGVCFDCLVTLNGEPNVRACITRVETGDVVTTQHGTGWAE